MKLGYDSVPTAIQGSIHTKHHIKVARSTASAVSLLTVPTPGTCICCCAVTSAQFHPLTALVWRDGFLVQVYYGRSELQEFPQGYLGWACVVECCGYRRSAEVLTGEPANLSTVHRRQSVPRVKS